MKTKAVFEKRTRRTYRYKEVSDNPIIGIIYIKQHALGSNPPKSITITIDAEEGE